MTVVCALARGPVTWLGSDTICVSTEARPMDCGSKWVVAHGWAYGVVGDARVHDLVVAAAQDLFLDMQHAAQFPGRLRTVYEAGGVRPVFGRNNDESCPSWQNSGILARAGQVFDVDGALAITPAGHNVLYARGGAGDLAMAAGHALLAYQANLSPEIVIEKALLAAAACNVYIRGVWQGRLAPARPAAADSGAQREA